jgi:hypothetical protein
MRVTAATLKSEETILYCKTSHLKMCNFSRGDFLKSKCVGDLSFGPNSTVWYKAKISQTFS